MKVVAPIEPVIYFIYHAPRAYLYQISNSSVFPQNFSSDSIAPDRPGHRVDLIYGQSATLADDKPLITFVVYKKRTALI